MTNAVAGSSLKSKGTPTAAATDHEECSTEGTHFIALEKLTFEVLSIHTVRNVERRETTVPLSYIG